MHKLFLKYDKNTYNWVGNSKMKPTDANELMKLKKSTKEKILMRNISMKVAMQ